MASLFPEAALKKTYHLHPGEIFVSREEIVISTLLGSCVAVCLWDEKLKIGGMNHIMLPVTMDDKLISTRYGNVATFVLYDMLVREGASPRRMTARLFGGANSMNQTNQPSTINVGAKNIEVTLKVIEKLNLKVTGKDLGGRKGRKILFDTSSGSIRMQFLTKFNFNQERHQVEELPGE